MAIEYRKSLKERVCKGEKLTVEERLWLVTNPLYNHLFGYPFLNVDILRLKEDRIYSIKVEVKERKYQDKLTIFVGVAGGKGEVISDMHLDDFQGDRVEKKPAQAVAMHINNDIMEYTIKFKSKLGLLDVQYGCEYYDPKMKLNIIESSGTGNARFSMLKKILSDNKVQYSCKDPNSDVYDALVFSIEWTEINQSNGK